jgi:hypothetical protein
VRVGGRELAVRGAGNGPIDAFVEGLSQARAKPSACWTTMSTPSAPGADARAVAYLELRVGDRTLFGVGSDANIVSASLKAIVSGLQRARAGHRTARNPHGRPTDHLRHDLRDGEQSPGASMTKDEKLRIARQLERLKVDVIEAGFPASSNGDFEAVQAIAARSRSRRSARCRAPTTATSRRAAEALKTRPRARIHTFIATSPLHMEKKLRMTPEQVLEQAKQSVRFARNLCGDIEFSPEDGYRSEWTSCAACWRP